MGIANHITLYNVFFLPKLEKYIASELKLQKNLADDPVLMLPLLHLLLSMLLPLLMEVDMTVRRWRRLILGKGSVVAGGAGKGRPNCEDCLNRSSTI